MPRSGLQVRRKHDGGEGPVLTKLPAFRRREPTQQPAAASRSFPRGPTPSGGRVATGPRCEMDNK